MAVNYKIGADASSFKQGVSEAQASLKTLDAALKVNEASFKAGGDAQLYMEQRTQLLSDKMTKQKQLVTQLQQGLRQMRDQGIAPTSVEYQRLETKLLNAQTAMLETQSAVEGLDEKQEKAAGSAGELANAVNGIGKKISLDQVISGIDRITGTLKTAAGAAVDLGEKIWNNVMNAAKWADDSATAAMMYGVDLDTYLRVQKLVTNGMDTSVDAILKSQQRLKKNIGTGSDSFVNTLKELGLAFDQVGKFGETNTTLATNDPTEMFWRAGAAIMALSDSFEQEAKAQELFGKSWRELIPLFSEYTTQEAFDKALDGVKTNTEEEVNNLATLNDKVSELQGNIETLTNKGWAALAPSLTSAADALNGLLGSVLEYLNTPEGKEALQQMSNSISTLFEDLGKIDPKSVVKNFKKVFDDIVTGFTWIAEHKEDVVTALAAIAGGFATLKISEGFLTGLQLIAAIKGITIPGVTAAGAGAAASGASGGGLLSSAATWIADRVTGVTDWIGGALNGAVIGDWFMNNTEPGQRLRNGEGLAGVWGSISTYFTETLPKNWNDFWETSYWGEIGQMYADNLKKWTEDHSASNSSILGKPGQLVDELNALLGIEPIEVKAEPEVPENAAEDIAGQVGTVDVPVRLVLSGAGYGGSTGGGTFDLLSDLLGGRFGIHANGLFSVPFDNYPALLHRGERVVPAREVSSRSYNSNLYVEKMIMNNGTDAQGLAAAMAAAQRRRMSGYGS